MNHPDLNQLAKEMKTLQLTLKKKWFDLILSGEKKEEYREIKPFWNKRLAGVETLKVWTSGERCFTFKKYDAIQFTNGYGKDKPTATFECLGITIGKGDTDLGAPKEDVFIIKLGKEISTQWQREKR